MNILICGIAGKMGQAIYNLSKKFKEINVSEGYEREEVLEETKKLFPNLNIFSNLKSSKNVDCVIDFSFHTATKEVLDFCISKNLPLVLGTTGHTEEEQNLIKNASNKIAIFKSNNMSKGVFVLVDLIRQATKMLEGWDIEIIEKHHNQKKDAPSGTALMMLEGVKEIMGNNVSPIVGRTKESGKREKNEIGIHSIRGGGIVGEHEIEFISGSEVIKITHEAFSKDVFAEGALNAAIFIKDKKPGMYEMKNLF